MRLNDIMEAIAHPPRNFAVYAKGLIKKFNAISAALPEVAKTQQILKSLIQPDGTLSVYRAMRVSSSWIWSLEEGTSLGIHWAYDPNFAISYDARKGIPIIICAKVHEKEIDWTTTLQLEASGEKEIRLHLDCPVRIEWIKEGNDARRIGDPVRPDLTGVIVQHNHD
jgi:hypothetical protein